MVVEKPVWTSSTFLLYAGGLTVLASAVYALSYLGDRYGDFAFVGWAALVLVVLYSIAHAFRLRGRSIAAGIFAFASVIAWAVFIGALWTWFGWLHDTSGSIHGFSVARLSLFLLILLAARDDRRRFQFPFISAISVVVGWLFVIDLISNGGDWTNVVTLLVGLVYLIAAIASDKPSAFWLHLGSGALIGGALLYWWHATDTDWALVSVAALVYMWVAHATKRSSWAVLGAIGLALAAGHFTIEWGRTTIIFFTTGEEVFRPWVPPLVFAFLGFLLVALGLLVARDRRALPFASPPHE